MSKKSQKKKKAASSLFKFLKNRKSVSVALGICLAVVASAYVATAKFSASGISGSGYTYKKIGELTWRVQVVDKKTKIGVGGVTVEGEKRIYVKSDPSLEAPSSFTDTSGSEGYAIGSISSLYEVYKNGKFIKTVTGDSPEAEQFDLDAKNFVHVVNKDGSSGKDVQINSAFPKNKQSMGKLLKVSATTQQQVADVPAPSWKPGEKYWTPTITLYSDGSGGSVAAAPSASATTPSSKNKVSSTQSSTKFGGINGLIATDKSIFYSVKAIDKKTKAGLSGVQISDILASKDANGKTSNGHGAINSKTGSEGYTNDFSESICKDNRGWFYTCKETGSNIEYLRISDKFAVGADNISSNKNKWVTYSFPRPLAKSEAELNKKFKAYSDKSDLYYPTVYLYSDGSGGYVGKTWDLANKNGTVKTDTSSASSATSKVSSAASTVKTKVSSAATKVKSAVTGTNKTVKVNTTPTKKDQAKFSEALPPAQLSMTRNLNFQFKDATTHQPCSGPVKITISYKECSTGGCGGTSGSQFKTETFNVTTNANGVYALALGIANVPGVKKSVFTGKTTTTNRYFFFYGKSTNLVRHLYISDINGGNQKEVPIGNYPFATKTEAAAQKFQLKLYTYDKVLTSASGTDMDTTVRTTPTGASQSNDTEANSGALPSNSTPSTTPASRTTASSDNKTTGNYQVKTEPESGFFNMLKGWLGI